MSEVPLYVKRYIRGSRPGWVAWLVGMCERRFVYIYIGYLFIYRIHIRLYVYPLPHRVQPRDLRPILGRKSFTLSIGTLLVSTVLPTAGPEDPHKALCGGIPGDGFGVWGRFWSHFEGNSRQKMTNLSRIDY